MDRNLAETDIQFVKGVGPRKASLLKRLGVRTVRDALYYFPFRYEDRRSLGRIRDILPGGLCTVVGRVVGSEVLDLRRRRLRLFGPARQRAGLTLFELTVSDESGLLRCKWFNQPYLSNKFKPGQRLVLSGTVKARGAALEMENPEYELLGEDGEELVHTGRIVPVYGATESLSTRQLRSIIWNALKSGLDDVEDPLPGEVRQRLGLPGLRESILNSHFPDSDADIPALDAWATPWQKRLSFDEFFMLEAGFAALRREKAARRGTSLRAEGRLLARLVGSLPFSLTAAQKRVLGEILSDMARPHPMNRMLQGDVGSGKTVVALAAMLTAVECGFQAALMAPTEILAGQHYITLHRLVETLGVRICLVTGSSRKRPLDEIASGRMDVVVGTHALIEEGVRFKTLGLAVIDEQHRFGVMQRAVLRKKSLNPDVLVMTATPIPRSLALTLYGELDYSVIDELPPGRTPVKTSLYSSEQKNLVYEYIREEVGKGGQVYVVYPVIEESEKTALRSAVMGAEALGRMFSDMRVALIHGRMKTAEKEAVMEGFKEGKIDILVSTTVIEVGVDVPNASLMLIVHAERFGLAQLHQLRGRVGRGRRESRCLLLAYEPLGQDSRRRLEVMCSTTDGFRVAEEDMKIRGPGDFLGTRQSGMPELRAANILRDGALLESARAEAFSLLERDPGLEGHPALRAAIEGFWRGKAELFKTG